MSYLIDSDVHIDFLWKDAGATHLVEDLLPAGVAISIVTYMESFSQCCLSAARSMDRAVALGCVESVTWVAG